jgi:hypothetical protein
LIKGYKNATLQRTKLQPLEFELKTLRADMKCAADRSGHASAQLNLTNFQAVNVDSGRANAVDQSHEILIDAQRDILRQVCSRCGWRKRAREICEHVHQADVTFGTGNVSCHFCDICRSCGKFESKSIFDIHKDWS